MCREQIELLFGIISEAMQGKRPHSLIVRLQFLYHSSPQAVPSSSTRFIYQTYLLMLFGFKKKKKKIIPQNINLPTKDNNEEAYKWTVSKEGSRNSLSQGQLH